MGYEVKERNVPARTVLTAHSSADLTTIGESIGKAMSDVYGRVDDSGFAPSGPPEVSYLGDIGTATPGTPIDIELRVPVAVTNGGDGQLTEMPEARCATTVHEGAYETIGSAYEALEHWIKERGYQVSGPPTETYVVGPDTAARPEEYRTEVAIPIGG